MIRSAVRPLAVVAALVFWTGCSHVQPPPVPDPVAPVPVVVSESAHVAFAGGGWRAHAGHTAWVLGLLHDGRTLDEAFARVGTISSNSGGSWFSTMLAYSDTFVTDIEAPDAINQWTVPGPDARGWLGRQQHLFDTSGCDWIRGVWIFKFVFDECVLDRTTGGHGLTWEAIVEDLVFDGYRVDGPLSGPRQGWAADKTLLLAATMLNGEPVLGRRAGGDLQYQACARPSRPVTPGGEMACTAPPPSVLATTDVTPVTFASLPGGGAGPPFFGRTPPPAGGPVFEALYVGPRLGAPTETVRVEAPLPEPATTDRVPVMTAAAASSAAAGFVAERDLTGGGALSAVVAALGEDAALAFALRDGPVSLPDLDHVAVEALAADGVVRVADGGAIDNSAVAHLVAHLQRTGDADGFDIVAFDNVTSPYVPLRGGRPAGPALGGSLANLFGEGPGLADGPSPGTKEMCVVGECLTLPSPGVFDAAALGAPAGPAWRKTAVGHAPPAAYREVIYTRYEVTTVDNPAFGVTAGTTGTLHAFTAVWTGATTAPSNATQDRSFTAYQDLLRFIHFALLDDGGRGLTYLEAALGLEPGGR